MFGARACRYALKEIVRHKGRTVTNVLGYAVAVAVVVGILSTVRPYVEAAVKVLKGVGTHFGAFVPLPKNDQAKFKHGGPFADGIYTNMLDKDIVSKVRGLPGVRDAAPYFLFRLYHEEYKNFLSIGGVEPGNIATHRSVCAPVQVLEGRYLKPDDHAVVLMEESFARVVNLGVGDTILVFGRNFKIIGIANSGIRPGKANMYATIETVREIANQHPECCDRRDKKVGDLNIVLIEVADAREQEKVFRAVQQTIGGATLSSYLCYVPASSVMATTDDVVLVLSVIVAVFAVLIAAKSQLASMVERTREIGILKAVGWPSYGIMLQIVVESICQALMGGIIGCIVAVSASWILHGSLVGVSFSAVAGGMILAVGGGIAAGILPAWRSYSLRPSEALRRL